MSILEILNEIAAEPGTNKKMEILKGYKDTNWLKDVIYLAMSPRVNFYIKKIPLYEPNFKRPHLQLVTLLDGIEELKVIKDRIVTGSAAIDKLRFILETVSAEDALVLEKIIAKDLRIGMGSTNVNKIFPGLIEDTPYMGAISYSEKAVKKLFETASLVVSQVKMDGRYVNAIIKDGEVRLESRQGEDNTLPNAFFVKELENMSDCVLTGELTIPGISRYESNGIVSSLVSIQGKISEKKNVTKEIRNFEKEHGTYSDALQKVNFTVWDILELDEYAAAKSDLPYIERVEKLTDLFADSENIHFVEGRHVNNPKEAMEHFQEVLERGEEGTILKSWNAPWKDGKPNWQVKMKLEMDIDLRIKGFQLGTGKNSQVYSALLVQSDDDLIITKVPGMKEEMMEYVTKNADKLVDSIVEVKCCGLSKSKNGETYSLLHPVFKKLRDDKNTCDTLESAKQIESMAKLLK